MKFKDLKDIIFDKLHLTRYWRNQKKYHLGRHTYLSKKTKIANKNDTYIGNFCSIANDVCIGIDNHPYNILTTHPMTYMLDGLKLYGNIKIENNNQIAKNSEKTIIDNDVWIGHGAIILSGVHIHDGAIIGAGAVVTHDVEPYSISVGIPAKTIKYRFNKETIDKLLKLKWWDLDDKVIETLSFKDIKKTIEELEKIRQI